MKARITAITASLALAAVAALAGERRADSAALHVASAKIELREPPARLAEAGASSRVPVLYPSAGALAAPPEGPARDPESGEWAMLLAGFLGAAAIARRRMSS